MNSLVSYSISFDITVTIIRWLKWDMFKTQNMANRRGRGHDKFRYLVVKLEDVMSTKTLIIV